MVLVADNVTWDAGEREKCLTPDDLSQAVSVKLAFFITQRSERLRLRAEAKLQEDHELRQAQLLDHKTAPPTSNTAPTITTPSTSLNTQNSTSSSPPITSSTSSSHPRPIASTEPQPKRAKVDAETMVASLVTGREVSVLYKDSGWVTGVVENVTEKTIVLRWPTTCTSNRFRKDTLAANIRDGEVKLV